jgi:hypothetical protein
VAVRCWRPSRQGAAAWEGPPRQPPATPGAARATTATGLYGVSRVLSFLGEAAGGSATPQPGHSRGSQLAHGPEGRRGPAQKLPPASGQRRRKWGPPPTPSTAEADTRATAAMAAGGNGGQHTANRTGTGGGPGSASAREAGRPRTSNVPDKRQLFRFSQLSNNGAASGTCNRPGIAQFHGTAFHGSDPQWSGQVAERAPAPGFRKYNVRGCCGPRNRESMSVHDPARNSDGTEA